MRIDWKYRLGFVMFIFLIMLLHCACITYRAHFGNHKFRGIFYEDSKIVVSKCDHVGCYTYDTFFLHNPKKSYKVVQ